jgi:hypothetical protein
MTTKSVLNAIVIIEPIIAKIHDSKLICIFRIARVQWEKMIFSPKNQQGPY